MQSNQMSLLGKDRRNKYVIQVLSKFSLSMVRRDQITVHGTRSHRMSHRHRRPAQASRSPDTRYLLRLPPLIVYDTQSTQLIDATRATVRGSVPEL